MTFPVYQFTILEAVMNGRAEFIAGADFYCIWNPNPDDFHAQPALIDAGAMSGSARLTGGMPSGVDVEEDY